MTTPTEYFDAVYQTFQKAAQRTVNSTEYFYLIGGRPVRLCFAGLHLVPLVTPAFEHLLIDQSLEPALTICLWDSQSTQTEFPLRPWPPEARQKTGEIEGFCDVRIKIVEINGTDSVILFDAERKLALYWKKDINQFRSWEYASPLREVLHLWTSNSPFQLIHAGAVGTRDGGVLLVGKGGSGKSTTTLACLNAGMSYLGDDYVMVDDQSKPRVYSLYNTAKLFPDDLKKFPTLQSSVNGIDDFFDEKKILFLHKEHAEEIVTHLPIKVILLPKVTGRTNTQITESNASQALLALAPTVLLQLPSDAETSMLKMSELVKRVPCFTLELGTDLSQIPNVITQLLSACP